MSHGDQLVVIGFPCNDFGGQEPGTADDYKFLPEELWSNFRYLKKYLSKMALATCMNG